MYSCDPSNMKRLLLFIVLGLTELLDHLKVTVAGVVLHVEPKVDCYALVALSHVVVPETGQVQHVSFVYPELVLNGFAKLWVLFRVR